MRRQLPIQRGTNSQGIRPRRIANRSSFWQISEPREAGEVRREPVFDRGFQGSIAEIRPAAVRFDPAHQRDPGLELPGRVGPGQRT